MYPGIEWYMATHEATRSHTLKKTSLALLCTHGWSKHRLVSKTVISWASPPSGSQLRPWVWTWVKGPHPAELRDLLTSPPTVLSFLSLAPFSCLQTRGETSPEIPTAPASLVNESQKGKFKTNWKAMWKRRSNFGQLEPQSLGPGEVGWGAGCSYSGISSTNKRSNDN